MLGRILGLAAVIAAISVGMAGMASRTVGELRPDPIADKPVDDGGWSARTSDGSSSAAASSGEVRIGRAADSHFYADADVNGTGLRMMVDSGASVVALTRRDAEAIGIDVDRLPVAGSARTAGGAIPVRPVTLASIEIDGIEVRHVQAAVIDADMGISLLGQSYLSRLDAVNVEGDTMTLR